MKLVILTSVIACVALGCSSRNSGPDPEVLIAGDKSRLLETLKHADTAGTALETFANAAADSSLRAKMEDALGIKESHPLARAGKTGPKKDILDKSSDALDVANEKVTKSGEVLDKASEVKKKTATILSKQ